MIHRYLPMTEKDRQEMLNAIGVSNVGELFQDIPESVRFQGKLDIPEALSEPALLREMRRLSSRNADFESYTSFLGAGMYDHHIPVVINHMISRSEFYTAYTPYQPEISQGELQAIFEFQSFICELTGMDVANASMYDGSTAFAEAGALAAGATRRKQLIVSTAVHPEARAILQTTAKGLNLQIIEIDHRDGATDFSAMKAAISEQTAGVMLQSPNFFGSLEDVAQIEKAVHDKGGLLIVSANPMSLGWIEPPGNVGADIVVGDVQPFGIPTAFGGPSCGYFAVKQKWMRRMPGRIVGQTVDQNGKRGFVLTLQTREQHIRREKATSNICSNQALLALCASIYMATMGKQGLLDVGELNMQKAHYARQQLIAIPGVEGYGEQPFFNEFVICLPKPATVEQVNRRLLEQGIIGGYDLSKDDERLQGHMLLAVTEQRSKQDIDQLATAIKEAVQ